MVKFSIGSIIPENEGWIWSTENISQANPRYIHVKLACASGVVDMSRVAAGKVLYDSRQITVTFARFRKGADYWRSDVQDLTNKITQAFNSQKTLTLQTKTNPDMAYIAYSFRYGVRREGIVQLITFTFDVQPVNYYAYSLTANLAYSYLEFLRSQADDDTLTITAKNIVCRDSNNDVVANAAISIYDDNGILVGTHTSAEWFASPLVVDMSADATRNYFVDVAGVVGWSVTVSWTKEEI